MAKSYCSIVLNYPADEVWAVIRPFDHYAWAGVEGETIIEDGKSGDQVGAVRRVVTGSGVLRQILLAHSDLERSYGYAFVGVPSIPMQDYVATIRVLPVTVAGRSFVEWWATFDCAPEERGRWVGHLEREGLGKWLAALGRFMAARVREPAL